MLLANFKRNLRAQRKLEESKMGRSGRGKALRKEGLEKGWNRKTRKSKRKEKRLTPVQIKRKEAKQAGKKKRGF